VEIAFRHKNMMYSYGEAESKKRELFSLGLLHEKQVASVECQFVHLRPIYTYTLILKVIGTMNVPSSGASARK
jgi:hypothetical protein